MAFVSASSRSPPPYFYSADDQVLQLPLEASLPTEQDYSMVHGEPNRPTALLQQTRSLQVNEVKSPLSLPVYSPNDLPVTDQSSHKSLVNAYCVPSKEVSIDIDMKQPVANDDESEYACSVISEPVTMRGLHVVPGTPTQSLPGYFSSPQMPFHVKTTMPKHPPLHQKPNFFSAYKPMLLPSQSYGNGTEDVVYLKEQLNQLMNEKANLEGQLESVIEECQTTLKERANLQSKLAKVEIDLAYQGETNTNQPLKSLDSLDGNNLHNEVSRLEFTLSQKRRELAVMNREIEKERGRAKQVSEDLIACKQIIQAKEKQLNDNAVTIKTLYSDLNVKSNTIQDLNGQIASLQTGIESSQSSKAWLQNQLQDAIDTKSKLQDELRSARGTNISQSIKLDNLQKENALFQQRINELQNAIFKDKAKLVSELEAIEADFLSKESTFAQVEASKEYLEQQIELKNKQINQLTTKLSEQTSATLELEHQLADTCKFLETLKSQQKYIEEEKVRLASETQSQKKEIAEKDNEINELQCSRSTLQQQLQQAEATMISNEGVLQGQRDSCNILKHELSVLKEAKSVLESELDSMQEVNSKLESDNEKLESLTNRLGKELQHVKSKQKETQNNAQSLLAAKEAELLEKEKLLLDLQSQSKDLQKQFRQLQNKVQSITSESGAGLKEKEEIITQLLLEKNNLQEELDKLTSLDNGLHHEIKSLKQENAHLQGELDSAKESGPSLDDFKRVLTEKNSLDKQLAHEKLSRQQDNIKMQAKIARLDTELKDMTKESKKMEEKLKDEIFSANKQTDELKVALDKLSNNSNVVDSEKTKKIDELQQTLKEKDETFKDLENSKLVLQEEIVKLKEEINEEKQHLTEVERASTLVTQKLKEDARRSMEQLEEQKNNLIIESERLKGRLAGINTAQQCMREHTASLEKSLAQKESQLHQHALETDSMLAEKDQTISELNSSIINLKDSESFLKSELEQALNELLLERQRANDTQRQLTFKEDELQQLSVTSNNDECSSLKEQISLLEQKNHDLEAEVVILKQQLAVIQAKSDSNYHDLQEKTNQVEMLEVQLKLTKKQMQHSQQELLQVQEHLKKSAHVSLPPPFPSKDVAESDVGDSYQTLDQDSQVDDVKPGEILLLKSQLGSKSKTLKNLQTCLQALKDDMGHIQSQMDQHSFSLQQSYKSSKEQDQKLRTVKNISKNVRDPPRTMESQTR